MKIYMAPMEGVTGYIYRNAFRDFYGSVDRYFTPFIVPKMMKRLNNRDGRDILPENNQGIPLIPQILTDDADGFVQMAGALSDLGYTEVNINLGCPSGTVVSKGRGAGFLADPDRLNRFLCDIFTHSPLPVSIKTRLGMEDPEEFERLLELYLQYPYTELIIHPRVRTDMYKNHPNLEVFEKALERCARASGAPDLSGITGHDAARPVPVYNGDIRTVQDYLRLKERFPSVTCWMLGRGLIADPGLAGTIRSSEDLSDRDKDADRIFGRGDLFTRDLLKLRAFHDRLMTDYTPLMGGDRNLLFKMKELWSYMGDPFLMNDCMGSIRKDLKDLRKALKMQDYLSAVDRIFDHAAEGKVSADR